MLYIEANSLMYMSFSYTICCERKISIATFVLMGTKVLLFLFQRFCLSVTSTFVYKCYSEISSVSALSTFLSWGLEKISWFGHLNNVLLTLVISNFYNNNKNNDKKKNNKKRCLEIVKSKHVARLFMLYINRSIIWITTDRGRV